MDRVLSKMTECMCEDVVAASAQSAQLASYPMSVFADRHVMVGCAGALPAEVGFSGQPSGSRALPLHVLPLADSPPRGGHLHSIPSDVPPALLRRQPKIETVLSGCSALSANC